MSGPIDILAIIAIVGTVINLIAIMQGMVIRRLAGATVVDLGQSTLGKVWELAVIVIFVVPIGLIFTQPLPTETPTPKFGERRFTPTEVRASKVQAELLTRGVPHGLFVLSLIMSHAMGIRPGRREFAEHGLVFGGWQVRKWDSLTSFSWIEGPPTQLTMRFEGPSRTTTVPASQTKAIDQLLRKHIPGEDRLQTVG